MSEQISKMSNIIFELQSSTVQDSEDKKAFVIFEENSSNDSSTSNEEIRSKPNDTPVHEPDQQTPTFLGEKHLDDGTPLKWPRLESSKKSSMRSHVKRSSNWSHSESDIWANELSPQRIQRKVRYRDNQIMMQRIAQMNQDICTMGKTLKLICEKLDLKPANSIGIQGIKEQNENELSKNKDVTNCSRISTSMTVIERSKRNSWTHTLQDDLHKRTDSQQTVNLRDVR